MFVSPLIEGRSYTRNVTKNTTRLEALLKVIMTPIVRAFPKSRHVLSHVLRLHRIPSKGSCSITHCSSETRRSPTSKRYTLPPFLIHAPPTHSPNRQILDLKGTPKQAQNDVLDAFLTITSTKPELQDTSFLSSLDMDPGSTTSLQSPGGSRVNLAGESILAALSSPPLAMSERAGTPKAEASSLNMTE